MRAKLSATQETKKEEEAVSKRNMDLIARQTKGLKIELAEARADAAEKSRQLVRHRKEVSSDTFFVVRGGKALSLAESCRRCAASRRGACD